MSATVMVPLAGAGQAQATLSVARALAGLRGATAHLLHVAERELEATEVLARLGLEAQQTRDFVIRGAMGDPADAIVRVCGEQPDTTLVMNANLGLEPASAGEPLGPIARTVLRQVTCPVVFVPVGRAAAAPWSLRTLMLPHDATPRTSAAIRPAAELVAEADAAVVVVYVAAPGTGAPSEPGSLPAPRYMDQRQYEWPAWASEFLDRFTAVTPIDRGRLRFFLGHGAPGSEILRVASKENVDLIVVAWLGELEAEHAKVIREVLHEAGCPVMVLRATAA